MLQDIIRASERAADLTRQLLAYAGKGKFVIEPVNASALVRDISELLRSSVPRTVELVAAPASRPAADRRRRQPDPAAGDEPDPERRGGHRRAPGRGAGDHRHPAGPARRPRRALPSRPAAARHVHLDRGDGRRLRDERNGQDADLRPVLHDEVHGPRLGPGGRARHRARAQGLHRRRERGGVGQQFHGAASGAGQRRRRVPRRSRHLRCSRSRRRPPARS